LGAEEFGCKGDGELESMGAIEQRGRGAGELRRRELRCGGDEERGRKIIHFLSLMALTTELV